MPLMTSLTMTGTARRTAMARWHRRGRNARRHGKKILSETMQQTNIAQLPYNTHLPMWVGAVKNERMSEWCGALHRPNAANSCRRRRDDSGSTAM
jgi:hypothetical protein